jgi:transcriptional regulator with XRE-family HTH domain
MSKTIYNRIKSALADKSKSNKDLADALKIAPETVSSWCTNSAQPSIKRLFEIAIFLDVEVSSLLVNTKSVKS